MYRVWVGILTGKLQWAFGNTPMALPARYQLSTRNTSGSLLLLSPRNTSSSLLLVTKKEAGGYSKQAHLTIRLRGLTSQKVALFGVTHCRTTNLTILLNPLPYTCSVLTITETSQQGSALPKVTAPHLLDVLRHTVVVMYRRFETTL